jgi:hypothetical protein
MLHHPPSPTLAQVPCCSVASIIALSSWCALTRWRGHGMEGRGVWGVSSFCASGQHAVGEWERWGLQTRGHRGKVRGKGRHRIREDPMWEESAKRNMYKQTCSLMCDYYASPPLVPSPHHVWHRRTSHPSLYPGPPRDAAVWFGPVQKPFLQTLNQTPGLVWGSG